MKIMNNTFLTLLLICAIFVSPSLSIIHSKHAKLTSLFKLGSTVDPVDSSQTTLAPDGPQQQMVANVTNDTETITSNTTNVTITANTTNLINSTNTTNQTNQTTAINETTTDDSTTTATNPPLPISNIQGEVDMGEYTVVKTYNREKPYYYTQGLFFSDNNTLVESAGLYHESGLHFLNLDDMSIKNEYTLEPKYFGEGADYVLDEWGEKQIYQLTWRERDVMIYDPTSLQRTGLLKLPEDIGEGWGLTKRMVQNDDGTTTQEVLITDGSAYVYFCDPKTLAVKKTLKITDKNNKPVRYLNELEYINGRLWANVYLTNYIAIINLETGKAERFLDFTALVVDTKDNFWQQPWTREYCLNGIAYNADTSRLIITGKKWTKLFEIRLND